jgi:hypothetical protein
MGKVPRQPWQPWHRRGPCLRNLLSPLKLTGSESPPTRRLLLRRAPNRRGGVGRMVMKILSPRALANDRYASSPEHRCSRRERRNFGASSEQQRPDRAQNRARSTTRRRSQATLSTILNGLQTSIPGSNPGGASKFSVQIRSFVRPRRKRMLRDRVKLLRPSHLPIGERVDSVRVARERIGKAGGFGNLLLVSLRKCGGRFQPTVGEVQYALRM